MERPLPDQGDEDLPGSDEREQDGDAEGEDSGSGSGEENAEAARPAAADPTLAQLREISALASWTVSTYKPGCGVGALRSGSLAEFWQSDGPQPHLLNVHFCKLVAVVRLRVYLDADMDESYTPTRLAFAAGTSEYDLVEFADWRWAGDGPKGWVDVGLEGCGGVDDDDDDDDEEGGVGVDGGEAGARGVLRCMILQVRVLENHQNGKDTHIRGVQIFARDERVKRMPAQAPTMDGVPAQAKDTRVEELRRGLEEADWMGEPEIR